MLQLLLAVINSNLLKILDKESYYDVNDKHKKLQKHDIKMAAVKNDEDIEEKKEDAPDPE